MFRCRLKGPALRSVACLPTHPVLFIAPSQRIYIIHRDSRIYMGIYMCGDIYGDIYICVEERVSEAPPAVVRRKCGYVGLYAWWRGRRRVRGGGRGGGGGGRELEKQPFVKTTRQAQHSKPTRQAQHTNRSTLEASRYDSSIHPKSLSE